MFHEGKGKIMKGKGFMAMPIEARIDDMGTKLTLEPHQVFIYQMWENVSE